MKPIKIISRLGQNDGFGNERLVYFDRFDVKSNKKVRHFILMNEGIKLMYEPFGWNNEWYADLIKIEKINDNTIQLFDMYIDVIIEGNGPTYRLVDLDEYAEAVIDGKVSIDELKNHLGQIQAFLEKHLHKGKDFPPRMIKNLM